MKTINFEIIYKHNDEIHQKGYVDIPYDEDESAEWYYQNREGFYEQKEYTFHDRITLTQNGANDEQLFELDEFYRCINDDIDFIIDAIENSKEEDNKTYIRNNLIIHINDGAKMEIEIFDDLDADYWVTIRAKFNQQHLSLAIFDDDICEELLEDIDSLYGGEERYIIDNVGDINREISKYYWSNDEFEKEVSKKTKQDIINCFKRAYARQLTREVEKYEFGDVLEQYLDEETNDKWLVQLHDAIRYNYVESFIKSHCEI